MTITDFTESDGRFDQRALRALWFAGRGEGEQATRLPRRTRVAREHGSTHLHRTGGDTSKVNYWYRRPVVRCKQNTPNGIGDDVIELLQHPNQS